MAQTLATPAFGIALKLGSTDDNNTATYTTIAEVGDLNFSISAQIEDVTSHSTANPWRTKLPTLLMMGPIEANVSFVPAAATHNPTTGFLYVLKNRLERAYQVIFPNAGPTWYGNGVIASSKFQYATAGVGKSNLTIEGSGPWTLA